MVGLFPPLEGYMPHGPNMKLPVEDRCFARCESKLALRGAYQSAVCTLKHKLMTVSRPAASIHIADAGVNRPGDRNQ